MLETVMITTAIAMAVLNILCAMLSWWEVSAFKHRHLKWVAEHHQRLVDICEDQGRPHRLVFLVNRVTRYKESLQCPD